MLSEILGSGIFWTILAVIAAVYILRPKHTAFPVVNSHPRDFLGLKASRELHNNAQQIIADGLAAHQGPFIIAAAYGKNTILLPASLAAWVKSNKDLDHRELAKQDFYADIPGFEAQSVLHSADEKLIGIIKTKLGPNNSSVSTMNESLSRGLASLWGEEKDWRSINWHNDTTGIIARVASSVFVGPEKADDSEWLDLIQGYVMAYFMAVGELHAYPPWSRKLVHWFLPNAIACRKYMVRARNIMNEVLEKRRQEAKQAEGQGTSPPEYNDALAWTAANPDLKSKAGEVQLSLAMAALFTTSEMFRQILIEIARRPQLADALRNEISQHSSAQGLSVAALADMMLLDSVMKESQRQSASLVVLERVALSDTVLPDGKIIPRGSHLAVDSTTLWSPEIYPDPTQFDAERFLRRHKAGDKSSLFVQSSPEYNVFGGGRHICPGRFFANNELKLALAHILLDYDLRLAEGCDPKPIMMGFYAMVNPMVRLEVRKRGGGAVPDI